MNAPVASPLRPRPTKHSPGVGVSHPDSSLAHATAAATANRVLICVCTDEDIVKAGGDSTHERQSAPTTPRVRGISRIVSPSSFFTMTRRTFP